MVWYGLVWYCMVWYLFVGIVWYDGGGGWTIMDYHELSERGGHDWHG